MEETIARVFGHVLLLGPAIAGLVRVSRLDEMMTVKIRRLKQRR